MWSSPCRRDGEVEKSALRAVFLFFPEGRRPRREVEPSLMVKKDEMILEKQHRRAVTSSLFGQERGLVRDVESSLEGGTRWFEEFRSHPPHKPHPSLQR